MARWTLKHSATPPAYRRNASKNEVKVLKTTVYVSWIKIHRILVTFNLLADALPNAKATSGRCSLSFIKIQVTKNVFAELIPVTYCPGLELAAIGCGDCPLSRYMQESNGGSHL